MFTLVVILSLLGAGDTDTDQIDFFEKRIRPVLVTHCYECHSSSTAEVQGGLLLDSRAGVRLGGDHGPAVVPGDVEGSLLIDAIRHGDLQMPPDKKLPERTIADFIQWVKMGAPDPREGISNPETVFAEQWNAVLDERLKWWSYQPVSDPKVPELHDDAWSTHPVDRFILRELRSRGLEPAPEADPVTLVRRLGLQVTGLSPGWSLVKAYRSDPSSAAWERLVDHILASPHLGERWARHWMDVVRYSDTYGYEADVWAKGTWRYRDYLIRAFNADLPFDQLVREHLAGDLLSQPRIDPVENVNESLIGLMFYHMGERRHDDTLVFNGIHQDMVDDQINAFSKTFLGLTMACSRCHDHKHDPVSQKEYYGLAGVFMSSRWLTNTVDLPERNTREIADLKAIKRDLAPRLAELWENDLTRIDATLLARLAEKAALAKEQAERKKAEEKKAGYKKGEKVAERSPLEDPFYPWSRAASAVRNGETIRDMWTKLAKQYGEESKQRRKENSEKIELLWDFRDGIPDQWSVDGTGLQEIVLPGDFTVSLTGDNIVGLLLPGGLYTNALSPRLNGAIRSPLLTDFNTKYLSFEHAGGDFAAHRTVFKNEFIAWHQKDLKAQEPGWVSFLTRKELQDHRHYIEFATKSSNPHFPMFSCEDCTREIIDDPRSWFGLTRLVAHDEEFTPHDELGRFPGLFAGPPPETLDAVAKRYAGWLQAALRAWTEGEAADDEIRLINWMLSSGLLTNRLENTTAGSPIRELVFRYRDAETRLATPWTVNGMIDHEAGYDYPLDIRGNYDDPGDPVPRGFPQLLGSWEPASDKFQDKSSSRLALAERVASPRNPLTARVVVNRIWHWLFGTGLVATPNDFGHLGDPPSHSELLDYLASRLVEEDWSLKKIMRSILVSRTWRQSGQISELASDIDPRNRLLSHYPLRRLEAEALRDSLLSVAGQLDPRLFGPFVFPYHEKETPRTIEKRLYRGPIDGDRRRAIYTRVSIMEPPPFLAIFNQPDPKIPTGRRDVTSSIQQSLALLNGPLTQEMADRWAEHLITTGDVDPSARLRRMFRSAFVREVKQGEMDRWLELIARLQKSHQVADEAILESRKVWKAVCHAVYNTKEFIYVR